jgi:hypothetical protein
MPEEKDERIKSLRTYKGDVDDILSKGEASASSILIAEQKSTHVVPTLVWPQDNVARNKFFIILGGILLLLGIIAISAVYYVKSTEQIATIKETKALISFSEEKDLPVASVARDELLNELIQEKRSFKLPVNSVLYVNTTDTSGGPAPVSNILSLLTPKMPGALSRSFGKEYMLGIYSFSTNEHFIILTVSDYAESFAGMLKWEKNIPVDLGKLFEIPVDGSGAGATFVDEAYRNKDLRVLRNQDGKTVLLYSFVDRNTLIITTNEDILTAVIGKYIINKSVR